MGVTVAGHDELDAGLHAAAADLADLDLRPIGLEAASVMADLVPVRSGRLRRSIGVTSSSGKAVVTVTAAHARVIQYGSRRRGIRPNRYAERTDAVMEARAAQAVEDEWNTITERHGLT